MKSPSNQAATCAGGRSKSTSTRPPEPSSRACPERARWGTTAAVASILLFVLLGSGCNCSRDRAKAAEDEVPVAPKAASPEITPPRASAERTVSLFEEGATCSLWEQGLVLDLGADAAESMRGFRLNPEP